MQELFEIIPHEDLHQGVFMNQTRELMRKTTEKATNTISI